MFPVTAAVLGAGTMGAQIALSLALGGADVRLWGRRSAGLSEAQARIDDGFDLMVENMLVRTGRKAETLGRISTGTDLARAVAGSRFVIEAVTEDLELKRDLLARAEACASEGTVLSSTTSALSPTDLQSQLARPGDFCVAHYAQPAHLVALVEVVSGCDTMEATEAFVMQLLAETGKTPVRCPDIPGFLWARIQHAVLREFASLVGRGLTTPEACDQVLKEGYAARLPAMGAFEHADLAGLDLLNGDAARAVWADLSNVTEPSETPVGTLFSAGHTGMKSGKGFYDWRIRDPEAFRRQRDEEIIRRIRIRSGAELVTPDTPGANDVPSTSPPSGVADDTGVGGTAS